VHLTNEKMPLIFSEASIAMKKGYHLSKLKKKKKEQNLKETIFLFSYSIMDTK